MNRREFFGWVGLGAIATSLPVAMAACSSQSTPSKLTNAPSRPDGFKAIGTVAELEQKGHILNQNVIIIRNPTDKNSLIAVNPNCTHAGCTVNWEQDQKSFVCPCHDSKFAPDGKVLGGPATEALQTYTAKLEGGNVLVKTKVV
ncbi:cytochrome B6 [Nostoc sp. 'Peltigera membranacea cyanobiont' 210A]|uniref:QcrA and Rieske domain-containing protein n=1 Tax=Nostoc sp. 'Peltigera membranacea cyanobiont' 210A TaxID=2014529 RepID=UPI000B953362|nr:ubiquinol-cytochrome c reductase iron-sulfur subunit [Nostoc sp. 'Peltigera membranacea cyanobiont' 210A]OYD91428.1 cytochrome B6 [Nostoc sp. 'Peltigera membranacea cyanobiont' 210A]